MTITLPGQYAKFITAVLGEAIAYFQLYGTTWHLQAALVMAGAALAVLGVPNTGKPPEPVTNVPSYTLPQRGGYAAGGGTVATLPPPPGNVTVTPPPATGPPA